VAPAIDHLHFFVILTTMFGAAAVTLFGGWFVIRYRRREPVGPHTREPAPATPMWLEWTVIVGLFGLFLTWWWIGYRQFMRLRIAPAGAMPVYVTAKQWMWQFAYPDGNRSIAALYVPVGRPVQLNMTSRDVIHSFYVPDFRVKQDVVPGRYTTVWFQAARPGKYEILCTQYCGTGHSMMRGEVIALLPEDFARWLAGGETHLLAGPTDAEPGLVENFPPRVRTALPVLGERVAAQHGCLRCHTTDGTPHLAPTWSGLYLARVPLSGGGEVLADEAYLTESMMDPLAKLHRGYPPVMPTYLGLLKPGEVAALIEYIKSLADVPGARRAAQAPQPASLAPAGAIGQPKGQLGAPVPGAPTRMVPEDTALRVPPLIENPLPAGGPLRAPGQEESDEDEQPNGPGGVQ
jgi:cytochrome c oxidase subunit 2